MDSPPGPARTGTIDAGPRATARSGGTERIEPAANRVRGDSLPITLRYEIPVRPRAPDPICAQVPAGWRAVLPPPNGRSARRRWRDSTARTALHTRRSGVSLGGWKNRGMCLLRERGERRGGKRDPAFAAGCVLQSGIWPESQAQGCRTCGECSDDGVECVM